MAERRMFAKSIIDSDLFLDMPQSAQCLYFHLAMRADDDGFLNNPKKIMRVVGAKDDDMKILIAKQLVICFESGVVVIKHWRIHNYIQKDRYKPTICSEEKALLASESTGAYTMDTTCIQAVSNLDTQVSIGKVSIGKDRIGKDNKRFTPPSLEEVSAYCAEINSTINPEAFHDYYSQIGWVCGKARSPMKDWKAAVRQWNRREAVRPTEAPKPKQSKWGCGQLGSAEMESIQRVLMEEGGGR